MKKLNLFLLLALILPFSDSLFGQTTTGEGFEGAAFPPQGWTTIGGGGPGAGWSRRTTANAGTTPTVTPFSGTGMARFTARNVAAGSTQTLVSPVIDLSKRSTSNSYISLYMFRDTVYNTDDSVTVWFNTTNSLTGATRLQGIKRYAKSMYPDSGKHDWYKYSFAIPSKFNSTKNYFLIQGTARGAAQGGNIFIDSVTWDAFPTFCEGKPDAGTVTASTYYICGNVGPSTITVSNYTNSTGSSLSWQTSTDSITFNTNTWTLPVNTGNFSAAIGTYRYIRAIVYCSKSGEYDTSNTIKLWIDNTATPPTITVTPNNAAICTGSTTPAMLVASGALTYSWTPSTGLSSILTDTVYALPSVSTFYTVSGVDDKGCTGTRNVAVQIVNGPNVTLTALDTTACEGDSVRLSAQAFGNGNTYLWSTGATTNFTMATATGAVTNYSVTVKNVQGCTTTRTQNIYGIAPPKAAYKSTVVSGRTVKFDFDGTDAADVYWNFSDGNESFQKSTTYTFSADGTFKVMLIANNPPCVSDTIFFDVTVKQTSGIENNVLNRLHFAPNPAENGTTLHFDGVENNIQLQLLDVTGRTVLSQKHAQINGASGVEINTNSLSNGIYYMHIISEKGRSIVSLEVQK